MTLQSLFLILLTVSFGQQVQPLPAAPDFLSNKPSDGPTFTAGQEYRIGGNDLLEISVFENPDLSVISRVTGSGTISLKMLGSVNVAGQTPQELEHTIEVALKKYIKDAHVQVFVREYASQPVSVIGAVKLPGIYQMQGQKSLVDMIAKAQGLDPANAGRTIQVIRRGSADVPSVTLTIDAEDLFQNGKPGLNIPIQTGDVINVPRAGSIFVFGEVVRPDEFVLRNGRNLTVAQAVARGGGFTKEAKKAECRIIRPLPDGTKEEIPIDLAKVLKGTADDVPMMANDILVIPPNKVRTGFNRALDTVISVAVGRAIYAGF